MIESQLLPVRMVPCDCLVSIAQACLHRAMGLADVLCKLEQLLSLLVGQFVSDFT
jgi:hypothetical protein